MTEQAEDKSAGSPLPPVRGRRQVCMLMLLAAVILASGIAIARACDLDARQRERVREAVGERLAAISKIRQEMAEEVVAEHDLLREELQEVLTPAQFAKWSQRMDEARERSWLFGKGRRGDRRSRAGGPDGPGRFRHRPRRPRGVEGTFRRFDADGDGKLTRQEVPPWLWPRLSNADANSDGAITRDEMESLPPERPRRPQR